MQIVGPCWWMDRGDCWEITHHPTREEAEADHADRIRDDYDEPLTVVAALALEPATAVQEPRRCYVVECRECGCGQHVQERVTECFECSEPVTVEQIAPDDPSQEAAFEVLPTHDIDGHPLSRVVLFEEA